MKRSEMVKKIIACLDELGDVPNNIKAKSLLAMITEAGMNPPIHVVKHDWPRADDFLPGWEKE